MVRSQSNSCPTALEVNDQDCIRPTVCCWSLFSENICYFCMLTLKGLPSYFARSSESQKIGKIRFICLGFQPLTVSLYSPGQSPSGTVLDNYSTETGPLWCSQSISQYDIVRFNVYISWTSSTPLTTFWLTKGLLQEIDLLQHIQ